MGVQLVVKDGLIYVPIIHKLLGKTSSIIRFVRNSVHATELLEEEGRLQAKVATRWNSEVKSVRSLLKVPAEKLQNVSCSQLNAYHRTVLQEFVAILSPFEEATNLTQGQNILTSSLVVPVIRSLRS